MRLESQCEALVEQREFRSPESRGPTGAANGADQAQSALQQRSTNQRVGEGDEGKLGRREIQFKWKDCLI